MTYSKQHLQAKLQKELEAEFVEVEDLSDGCGKKFNVVVVSSHFEGKPQLQRHRLVINTLAEEMKSIHALSQKAYTPEQWQEMKEAS